MKKAFFKQDGNAILYNEAGELVYYVPEYFFERGYAIVNGECITLMGLFTYARFDTNGKLIGKLDKFKYPSTFSCIPYKVEKLKDVKLTSNTPRMDYRTLKFRKGDQLIVSIKTPMGVENIEMFIKLFTTGKIPNTVDYDELHRIFLENIELNGEEYPVSAQLIGACVSESARALDDVNLPYRRSGAKSQTAYTLVNIKEIPKIISAFTAFSSENFDEAMVNATVNTNKTSSPLEKLFLK